MLKSKDALLEMFNDKQLNNEQKSNLRGGEGPHGCYGAPTQRKNDLGTIISYDQGTWVTKDYQ